MFRLEQNYHEPFNPSTIIRFQLPVDDFVSVKVYDMLGREVAVLVNERRAAGVHEVPFEAGGLAAGVYFYRLATGGRGETRKMLLIR